MCGAHHRTRAVYCFSWSSRKHTDPRLVQRLVQSAANSTTVAKPKFGSMQAGRTCLRRACQRVGFQTWPSRTDGGRDGKEGAEQKALSGVGRCGTVPTDFEKDAVRGCKKWKKQRMEGERIFWAFGRLEASAEPMIALTHPPPARTLGCHGLTALAHASSHTHTHARPISRCVGKSDLPSSLTRSTSPPSLFAI